jgi:hypothetical protein
MSNRNYRLKSQRANNATGNGLSIKQHIVKSHRVGDDGIPGYPFIAGKIRQCTLYPKTAEKFVAYRLTGELGGSRVAKRAKWARGETPPADFVELGKKLGVLA